LSEKPAGLVYRPEFVGADEERDLLAFTGAVDFRELEMRGQVARRTVRQYGLTYEYESGDVAPGDPLPAQLVPLRDRAAELAGVEPDDLAQILVTRYPPGAPIGWHRDAPMFGLVVGVSLGSTSRMRFQRGTGADRQTWELELAPRSAYVLTGSARWAWQHSVPPVKELRYSITFRTLRDRKR
jgi:DNA oxidative demethylase